MKNFYCLNLSHMRKYLQDKKDTLIFNSKLGGTNINLFKNLTVVTATSSFIILAQYNPVYAGAISNSIIKKFNPIVDLIQALGYPVCLCSMTCGGVMMAFNKRKGISLIRDGAIAYLVIQFVPMFMQILSSVGSEIK